MTKTTTKNLIYKYFEISRLKKKPNRTKSYQTHKYFNEHNADTHTITD